MKIASRATPESYSNFRPSLERGFVHCYCCYSGDI